MLDTPLAVVVQSGSAAGKSTLVDAVLSLMPTEQRLSVSAMTGQSLFHLGESELAHKVLSVAEADGANRAAYPLRLLQSEGELSIASTGKDPAGGLVTRTYRSRGPVALFLTTTAPALDDELANRCVVLGVDEDPAQTRAILAAQRHAETLDGLLARRDRDAIRLLHANAQRLLEPLAVVNPLAPTLAFADGRTRARRDQAKYLTLIRAVALLHQHQRPRKRAVKDGVEVVYIEATAEDVAVADRLAPILVGGDRVGELAPQTRRLLGLLDAMTTDHAGEAETGRCGSRGARPGSTPAGPTSPSAATSPASSTSNSPPCSAAATPSPTPCSGTKTPAMTREAMGTRSPRAAETISTDRTPADAGEARCRR